MGLFCWSDEAETPPKEGLARLAEIIVNEAEHLLLLNLLCLLLCLPVLTVGPALGAMTATCQKMLREEKVSLLRDFLGTFRRRFWRFLPLGIICAGVMILCFLVIFYYAYFSAQRAAFLILYMIALPVGIFLALGGICLFPLACSVDLPLRLLLRDAVLLGAACWKKTVPAFFAIAAILLIGILAFPFSMPLWLVCILALPGLIGAFAAEEGIRVYILREDKDA